MIAFDLGRGGDLGSLAPGAEGDAAVLRPEEGDDTFGDAAGHEVQGRQQFAPVLTVRAGRRWHPR